MAKVIVWTQAYNAEKTLRRAMDSILQQTYPDLEYYVLNNGSSDGTGAIIEEYAKKDSRVIPLSVEKNDLEVSADFLPYIFQKTSAKWFVWCDADDLYNTTYLEKIITFAESNTLDIASCGYRKIDSRTGDVIKERVLKAPLILQGDDFATHFVEYRGFTIFLWAKLTSIDILREVLKPNKVGHHASCCDSVHTLKWFQAATRAGIYPEALYDYYQYPTSVSHAETYIDLDGYLKFWNATKEFLESRGPISQRNQAFLYAIYLSLFEEIFQLLSTSTFSSSKKLEYMQELLREPNMCTALQYKDSGEFQILAARPQLVERIRIWIAQQCDESSVDPLAKQTLDLLDTIWNGAYA